MLRGVAVWCLFMAIETVHGILRSIFLVPRVGLDVSNRIGWPIAASIVFGVTWLTFRWVGLSGTRALLWLGTIWALLTLIFELAIGALQGLDAAQLAREINPLSGGLLMYSLLVAVFAPCAVSRLQR